MRENSGLTVAVAQFVPGADRQHNLAVMCSLAHEAVSNAARLIIFPEYSSFFLKPFDSKLFGGAEPLDGDFVRQLATLAVELDVYLVAGMIEKIKGDSRPANTLVALDPSGNLVARYRKLHLYDAFGFVESEWIHPGEMSEPEIFISDGISVGLQTCYDLRFPEVSRRLVDAGADVLAVPAAWVPGELKEQHWLTLLAARAIENTVYVAAADHSAPTGIGLSCIFDPAGLPVATAASAQEVVCAPVSAQRIADVRATNPALTHRRFSVVPH